jgi:ribose transport system substrate-binding protein
MPYVAEVLRSRNLKWFLIIPLVVSLVLAGCGEDKKDQATPQPTEPPQVTIGLSLSNMGNPFFVSVKDGAEAAATRLGAKLIVEDATDDPELQKTQIQSLIDQKVSVLLINPVSSDGVVPAIEAANTAGIPVLTIDRSAAGGKVVSHVASDNLAGGKMAGDYLAELLNSEGKVVELQGIPGTSAAQARGEGFNQALAAYPNIQVIAQQTANFDRAEGQTVFAQILAENPAINGVFAHNDEMILGAIEAAKEAGRDKEIAFVGFDAVDDAVAAVESGELSATVAQQPAEMGRVGVETALKYLQGETIAEFIPVDLALITK